MTLSLSSLEAFQRPLISSRRLQTSNLQMVSGNKAIFGVFSPAVVIVKFALGDAKFNKLRGKAISLHSQAITEWCLQYGAYNLRLKLIKKAKKNGDRLGFLI